MNRKRETRPQWRLTAQEVAHAMPVLQSAHPALHGAPAPRLATIRELAQRCRVSDGALRTALSRACSAGSLELSGGRYRLGPRSMEEAAAARALLARTRGYALAVVLEGERSDLARLKEIFGRLGFRPLQRSVWIGARTKDDRLSAALARARLAGSVVVFQADEVDADARQRLSTLWRLADRAKELRKLHQKLADYLDEPKISASEAAWRCVIAAPVWYRIAVHDEPPFPLDLAGADYPVEALHAEWRARLHSKSRELVALWKAER
jgi:DNA-binding transcriptional regulator PaaX